MHELSVCYALVEQAEAIARQRKARVVRLLLHIGPLSGVEAGLLRRAFPLASAGSACEGAALDIEDAPVSVHCPECKKSSVVAANKLICPACGNWRTSLESGDEMVLQSVELEAWAGGGDVLSSPA
ncbi:MAG: hydrogenase maturation nickel metallochaperone HypA [Gammaproteobacteria bacterium]|jgi:hydrogenase nickel incorporation protein HypA/HybF|nr:hydrogenase maturation nickel metallochaperone HypA [Gammaproteobacteria bacterium]